MLRKWIRLCILLGILTGVGYVVVLGMPFKQEEVINNTGKQFSFERKEVIEEKPIEDELPSVVEKVTGNQDEEYKAEIIQETPVIQEEKTESREPVVSPKEVIKIVPEKKEEVSIPHHNKELKNINIMFLGIEDDKLKMFSVYSINKENNWKSGTVFVPTNTLIPGTKDTTVSELFYQEGPEEIKKVLEENMEIEIAYYVKVDRNLMSEVEPYIEPIYIDGEKINLARLFTMEITPKDEVILASLLKRFTNPSIYFGLLPKLVWTCKQYIETDFNLTWSNLFIHYEIAKNIDTTAVTKKVLPGKPEKVKGKLLWIPSQQAWLNSLYEVTK